MGSNKTALELDGRSLLDRALACARAVTANVRLVGRRDMLQAFGPVIEDMYPDRGPLGGIHAALQATSTELNLMLAVDTPSVTTGFLRFLIERAKGSNTQVTVPRVQGRWQPLCAVYRKPFATVAEQALQAGRNKIDPLFSLVPVLAVEEAEMLKLAFDPDMFENLNTPEDWERWRKRAGGS
jgi:molybdopterin-guanine dinucleotide biosynthesis protein A